MVAGAAGAAPAGALEPAAAGAEVPPVVPPPGATGMLAAGPRPSGDGDGVTLGPFTRSRIELSCGRSMDRARLVTMKSPARTVVARDRTFADPRGPR